MEQTNPRCDVFMAIIHSALASGNEVYLDGGHVPVKNVLPTGHLVALAAREGDIGKPLPELYYTLFEDGWGVDENEIVHHDAIVQTPDGAICKVIRKWWSDGCHGCYEHVLDLRIIKLQESTVVDVAEYLDFEPLVIAPAVW